MPQPRPGNESAQPDPAPAERTDPGPAPYYNPVTQGRLNELHERPRELDGAAGSAVLKMPRTG